MIYQSNSRVSGSRDYQKINISIDLGLQPSNKLWKIDRYYQVGRSNVWSHLDYFLKFKQKEFVFFLILKELYIMKRLAKSVERLPKDSTHLEIVELQQNLHHLMNQEAKFQGVMKSEKRETSMNSKIAKKTKKEKGQKFEYFNLFPNQEEENPNQRIKKFYQKTLSQKQNITNNMPRTSAPKMQISNFQKKEFEFASIDPNNEKENFDEESEYAIVYRPQKNSKKMEKSTGWFSKFITQPKRFQETKTSENVWNNHEDSFQLVKAHSPGPQDYQILNNCSKQKNYTFSKADRFTLVRPLTASTNYSVDLISQKRVNNKLESVCFGTSKNNLRSEIKKIEQCEWKRSHCCIRTKGMGEISKQRAKNQDANFGSASKRFEVKKSYSNKDFYQSVKKKKNSKCLPNYYFMDPTFKQNDQSLEDKREYLAQSHDTLKKNASPKIYQPITTLIEQKKFKKADLLKESIYDLKQQIPEVTPKNSLCERSRKPINPPIPLYHPIQQVEEEASHQIKKEYPENPWVIPSFNIKFQSTIKTL